MEIPFNKNLLNLVKHILFACLNICYPSDAIDVIIQHQIGYVIAKKSLFYLSRLTNILTIVHNSIYFVFSFPTSFPATVWQ